MDTPYVFMENYEKYQYLIQLSLNSLNPDGLFTMVDSNLFLSPYEIILIAPENKYIFKKFFLIYHEIVLCVYSLELSYQGDSNEYTQYTIIV